MDQTTNPTAAERAAERDREAPDPEADEIDELEAAEAVAAERLDVEDGVAERLDVKDGADEHRADEDAPEAAGSADDWLDPDQDVARHEAADEAETDPVDGEGLDRASEAANISNREQTALARLLADGELMPAEPDDRVERYGEDGPLVVFVHGGYFRPGIDRTHARPTAKALAELGYRVLLPEYRRELGNPDAALTDLAELARSLDEPAVWMGHSAGGFLVLHRAFDDVDFRAIVALAPVASLAETAEEHLGEDAVRNWIGATPSEQPETYRRLDPQVLAATRAEQGQPLDADPRIFLLHGGLDVTVPVKQTIGFPAAKKVVEAAHHFDLIDPESRYWCEVCTTLQRLAHA